jgi:peptidyl-prolyl cis-trans isomerase C
LFAQLAASQSLDTSNNTRSGDLNWFSRGTMVKVIEDTAFSLKPHGLSKPIKSKLGWHVIELVGKRAASQKTLDVVRAEIISSLQHQRLDQWYQELEQASKVVIKPVEYQ